MKVGNRVMTVRKVPSVAKRKAKPKPKVKRVVLGKGYLFFTKDDHGCELSDGSAMWQGHPFGALIKLRNLGNPKIRLVAEIKEAKP